MTVALVLPVAAGSSSVLMRLSVSGGVIVGADLTRPSDERAGGASSDATVTAKLAALVGLDCTDLGVDLPVAISELRAKLIAHQSQLVGGIPVHPAADTANVYPRDASWSIDDAIQQVGILRDVLTGHLLRSSQAPTQWHNEDDTENVFVTPGGPTLAAAVVGYADARRVFERHRLNTTVHDVADTANALSAVDPLSDAIIAILDYLTSEAPSVPAGAEAGGYALDALFGFVPARA